MTTTTERKTCEELVDEKLRIWRKFLLEYSEPRQRIVPFSVDSVITNGECWEIDHVTTYQVKLDPPSSEPTEFFELDWLGNGGCCEGGWTDGRYIYQDRFGSATREITDLEAEGFAEMFGIADYEGDEDYVIPNYRECDEFCSDLPGEDQ